MSGDPGVGRQRSRPSESAAAGRGGLVTLLVILVLMVGLAATIGYAIYAEQRRALVDAATGNVQVYRDQTITALQKWRERTLTEGAFLAGLVTLREQGPWLVAHPEDEASREILKARLDTIVEDLGYQTAGVCGADGRPLAVSPPDASIHCTMVADLIRSTDATLSDMHADSPGDPPHVTYVGRLSRRSGSATACLVLEMDPTEPLTTLLDAQLTGSKTAETLLVERDGEDVVYLNPLRFEPDAALTMRLPLESELLPAAIAVRSGVPGTVEGADYRGRPVIAAYGPVPGTPWHVVSKLDREEVLGELERSTLGATGLAAALLLASGMGILAVWRGREVTVTRGRLEAERRRAVLSSKYDLLMRSAVDGVVLLRDDLTIEELNEAAAAMYGLESYDGGGVSILDVQDPACRQDLVDALARLDVGGGGVLLDTAQQRGDGARFDAQVSAQRVVLGEDERLLLVVRDVTEQVRARRELERRTGQLARSNEELERFAHAASHDLQEPLRQVTSYAQLILRRYRDTLDDDARDYIGYLVEGTERMRHMVTSLLEYASSCEGPARVPVGMDAVLGEALANLSVAIQESGARVTSDALPAIAADHVQMVRLLQNLLSNAVRFTAEGVAPEIRVSAERGQDEWVFSVADNGVGIAPEDRERMFVVFRRLQPYDSHPGAGIGLSTCRRIVESYGGRIEVESQPGEGSVFRFSIPDVKGDASLREE